MVAQKDKKSTSKQIQKALDDGVIAKIKLYQGFSKRIAKGEQLTPAELKLFKELETEFESELNGEVKDDIVETYDKALEYLGVSRRTLHVHLRKGTFKQNPDGSFKKSELDTYLDKYKKQSDKSDTTEVKKGRADLRLKIARARREELLVSELQGNLMSRDDIISVWCKRVAVVTSGLEAFADRLPPLLEGKTRHEMREILKNEVWELRNAYATTGHYTPEIPK